MAELAASIIVPVRTHLATLPSLLEGLVTQTLDAARFEVLLVENGEGQVAGDARRRAGALNARVLRAPPGAYAARNAGLAAARAPALVFTDADCRPHPDWLVRGLAHLDAHARAAGRIDLVDEGGGAFAADIERARFFRQERYAREGFGATANLFVRREVFDAVGPFDADLRSGGDAAHGAIASRAGFSIVYAHDAVVEHPTRALPALLRKAARVGFGFGQGVRSGALPRDLVVARALERAALVVTASAAPGTRARTSRLRLAPGLAALAAVTAAGLACGLVLGEGT